MKRHHRPRLALLLLVAAVAGFLGYCLGYARSGQNTGNFSITTQRTVSQAQLAQGGEKEEKPEETADAVQTAPEGESRAEEETAGKIDLNHADAKTLQQLPGIGPKRAEAIVRYREENGLFAATDEVMKVPGIGEELYEQIKDLVTVEF